MFDRYQREIHYLRLSVTDLCNLRCRYCMPDGVEKLEREAVLTYEEFLRLAALFAQCGIDTVRVTGGEPPGHPDHQRGAAGRAAVCIAGRRAGQREHQSGHPAPGGVPADHRPGRFCRRAGGLAGGAGKRPAGQAELRAAGGRQ